MYAYMTSDGREKFYVEIEGAREEDYFFFQTLSKNKKNATKRAQKYVDEVNSKYSWRQLRLTGIVCNIHEFDIYRRIKQ